MSKKVSPEIGSAAKRVVLLDFDGCFGYWPHEDRDATVDDVLSTNKALVDWCKDADVIGSFSARQDKKTDDGNARGGRNGSSFSALEACAKKAGASVDKTLLADYAAEAPSGTAWRKATTHPDAENHSTCLDDPTKVLMLLVALQRAAAKFPGESVVVDVVDDKKAILDLLNDLLAKYPEVMPETVRVRLMRYAPDASVAEPTEFASVTGAGPRVPESIVYRAVQETFIIPAESFPDHVERLYFAAHDYASMARMNAYSGVKKSAPVNFFNLDLYKKACEEGVVSSRKNARCWAIGFGAGAVLTAGAGAVGALVATHTAVAHAIIGTAISTALLGPIGIAVAAVALTAAAILIGLSVYNAQSMPAQPKFPAHAKGSGVPASDSAASAADGALAPA